MDASYLLLGAALIAGIYMAWSIGANDVANAMGTSVGSHALTIRQAVLVAAIFEFVGALMVGEQVTNTIKQEIVDPSFFVGDPILFAGGMTAALLATAAWLQLASAKGLPVSTTHSIIGAVVGFGLVAGGPQVVKWQVIANILISWLVSPICGGVIAFGSFYLIRRYILDSIRPVQMARRLGPWMVFVVLYALLFLFLQKSLKMYGLVDSLAYVGLITASLSGVVALFVRFMMRNFDDDLQNRAASLQIVERVFAWLQVITACFMALAHGSNDVANAIGPVAAVASIAKSHVLVTASRVPYWLLALGGLGIVIGLATYGKRVIETIGTGITEITPTRGFAAESGAAFTILVGSYLGLPLSTTQVLVGAVIGVGLARGIAGLNLSIIRRITSSWVVTIPATASVSAVLCYVWLNVR